MGHLPGGLPSSHHHLRTHVDLRLGRAPSTGGQEATARGEAQVGQVQAADWGRGGLETQAAEWRVGRSTQNPWIYQHFMVKSGEWWSMV